MFVSARSLHTPRCNQILSQTSLAAFFCYSLRRERLDPSQPPRGRACAIWPARPAAVPRPLDCLPSSIVLLEDKKKKRGQTNIIGAVGREVHLVSSEHFVSLLTRRHLASLTCRQCH
jgi:hypothetical protein